MRILYSIVLILAEIVILTGCPPPPPDDDDFATGTPEETATPPDSAVTPTPNPATPTPISISTPTPVPDDADLDGFPVSQDCNDHDPAVYPGATETCDGVDNDCDKTADEEPCTWDSGVWDTARWQ